MVFVEKILVLLPDKGARDIQEAGRPNNGVCVGRKFQSLEESRYYL